MRVGIYPRAASIGKARSLGFISHLSDVMGSLLAFHHPANLCDPFGVSSLNLMGLISSKYIPCVNPIGDVGKVGTGAVGNDRIAESLEFVKIVDYLAAEEC